MAVQKRYQARLKVNKEIHLIYRKRAFTAYAVNLSSEGMRKTGSESNYL
ncbi:MAG: hypothetical protein L3J28_08565 [Candidatus Polarisedimenticolaceae bacterium]|nr:hypothetical protein [Candidatus Polarisedimenticolaceae bacterium]